MRFLVDSLYLAAMVLYTPMLLWRMAVHGKWRRGWGERFGGVPRRTSAGGLIWIHAVSVGEANATRTLVEQLRAAMPQYELAFSATTDTGFARLGELYPGSIRFHYPLDFSPAIARAFRRLRPSLIVLMELEVWPNVLGLARRAGVPVVVVNGRLSRKSFVWYRRLRPLVRPMFSRLSRVCAQDATYAERFVALGTPTERVAVTGSLKYDTAVVADRVAGQDELAAAMGLDGEQQLLVAGSTGPGEEETLLAVYRGLRAGRPSLRLALVPRKPERFDEVAGLIQRAGLACWRRSGNPDGSTGTQLAGETVALGDTMGELRKFYALAQIAFVGRSLVPMGGSDVMEAAGLGKPVVVGPFTENFAEPVARLTAAGGCAIVRNGEEFQRLTGELLADAARRQAMAAAARAAVVAAQGATRKTVEIIGEAIKQADALADARG